MEIGKEYYLITNTNPTIYNTT